MTKLDELIKELKSLGFVHIRGWHKLSDKDKEKAAKFFIELAKKEKGEGEK